MFCTVSKTWQIGLPRCKNAHLIYVIFKTWFMLSMRIYICRLGGPYSEKLWPRSWKCCPRPAASGSIFKTSVTVFHYTDRPKPVNNLFIFSSLSNDFVYSRKKTHASVTVTVVRDRKIRTALRTNQIAEFVTVTAWEKINRVMDARGKFGEHERSIRVARGAAESNSSFLSALQSFQAHP